MRVSIRHSVQWAKDGRTVIIFTSSAPLCHYYCANGVRFTEARRMDYGVRSTCCSLAAYET